MGFCRQSWNVHVVLLCVASFFVSYLFVASRSKQQANKDAMNKRREDAMQSTFMYRGRVIVVFVTVMCFIPHPDMSNHTHSTTMLHPSETAFLFDCFLDGSTVVGRDASAIVSLCHCLPCSSRPPVHQQSHSEMQKYKKMILTQCMDLLHCKLPKVIKSYLGLWQ